MERTNGVLGFGRGLHRFGLPCNTHIVYGCSVGAHATTIPSACGWRRPLAAMSPTGEWLEGLCHYMRLLRCTLLDEVIQNLAKHRGSATWTFDVLKSTAQLPPFVALIAAGLGAEVT